MVTSSLTSRVLVELIGEPAACCHCEKAAGVSINGQSYCMTHGREVLDRREQGDGWSVIGSRNSEFFWSWSRFPVTAARISNRMP